MPFGRRPNATETAASRAARQAAPKNTHTPERVVVSLRRDMGALAKQNAIQLRRMREGHDRVGASTLQTTLGTDDYNDFVADFNTLRTAVLQMCPDLAGIVPEAL